MIESSWIRIDKLMRNGRNARTHSRKQIRQIGRPGQKVLRSPRKLRRRIRWRNSSRYEYAGVAGAIRSRAVPGLCSSGAAG